MNAVLYECCAVCLLVVCGGPTRTSRSYPSRSCRFQTRRQTFFALAANGRRDIGGSMGAMQHQPRSPLHQAFECDDVIQKAHQHKQRAASSHIEMSRMPLLLEREAAAHQCPRADSR